MPDCVNLCSSVDDSPRASRVAMLRRRLFASVSALSLILCLAAVGLWVRSYWRSETIRRIDELVLTRPKTSINADDPNGAGAVISHGWIAFWWSTFDPHEEGLVVQRSRWQRSSSSSKLKMPLERRSLLELPGLRFDRETGPSYGGTRMTVVRLVAQIWMLAIPFALLPAAWILHRGRTRDQRRTGHCQACGYDLRASPGRCPECGRVAGASR